MSEKFSINICGENQEYSFKNLFQWIIRVWEYSSLSHIQETAIKQVLNYSGPNKNFLTILPTGTGKSVIFQGPVMFKACKGSKKVSIVVSPLQALLQEQVEKFSKKRLDFENRVRYIDSTTTDDEYKQILELVKNEELSLLYVAPERFLIKRFFEEIISYIEAHQGIDTIIFDEAHCITSWGNDFRPKYVLALRKCLEIQKRIKELTIQLFSATMPAKSKMELIDEIILPSENVLPHEEDVVQYAKSLCPIQEHIDILFEIVNEESDEIAPDVQEGTNYIEARITEIKIGLLAQYLKESTYFDNELLLGRPAKSRVIVFTRKQADAQKTAEQLRKILCKLPLSDKIDYYHADRSAQEKKTIREHFESGELVILCATKAFGLGMDIPQIHHVVHLTPPSFIEDYLQEVGRAGRDPNMYRDAFPYNNGNREHIKSLCLYNPRDLVIKKNIEDLSWEKLVDSFNCIKNYIAQFEASSINSKYYNIPIDVLFESPNIKNDQRYSKNERFNINEKLEITFFKALNWLSKETGLNRIRVGFMSTNTYYVGFNQKKCPKQKSSPEGLLFEYIQKKWNEQSMQPPISIDANELIADSRFEINDNNELEALFDKCFEMGFITRDYSSIFISLKKKNPYYKSRRPDHLSVLKGMLELCNNNPNFNDELCSQVKRDINGRISNRKIQLLWPFFYELSRIYSVDEIYDNCINLLNKVGNSESQTIKWLDLAQAMNIERDSEALKIFVLATHKLEYTYSRLSQKHECIQISIVDNRDIDVQTIDKESFEKFNSYYASREDKQRAMSRLVTDFSSSEERKEYIKEYSKNA